MVKPEELKQLVAEKIQETGHFLVEFEVRTGNNIYIEVDHPDGMAIKDCVAVSRFVEHDCLDREEEDFELQVTSPGLDKPFKVIQQYTKNIGRNVKVKLIEDQGTIEGLLKEVNDEYIVVETRTKERVEGRKKKEWVVVDHEITYPQIKETKVVISFK